MIEPTMASRVMTDRWTATCLHLESDPGRWLLPWWNSHGIRDHAKTGLSPITAWKWQRILEPLSGRDKSMVMNEDHESGKRSAGTGDVDPPRSDRERPEAASGSHMVVDLPPRCLFVPDLHFYSSQASLALHYLRSGNSKECAPRRYQTAAIRS
jgi:hypothetical protein